VAVVSKIPSEDVNPFDKALYFTLQILYHVPSIPLNLWVYD
jgi:hypothetical protein